MTRKLANQLRLISLSPLKCSISFLLLTAPSLTGFWLQGLLF